ncbi:hypothetical protein Chor_003140 [Crotalus horridus]
MEDLYGKTPLRKEKALADGLAHSEPHQQKSKHISTLHGKCEEKEKKSAFQNFETNFSNIYGSAILCFTSIITFLLNSAFYKNVILSRAVSLDLLPAWNGEESTKHFLHEVVDIIFSYIKKAIDRKSKVLDFHHPHQLLEGLEGFNLELFDHPEPLEQILVDCRDTLKYGVKTAHPRYFNQLSSGLDIIGLVGEWLTATANTNMFTYEIAPVFIIMEEILLKKMQEIIGWEESESDGIFSPGGSISNLYSVLVARYKYYPEIKTKGMAALPEIILFISEHSHYSIKKAAAVAGIGMDNVIAIKCDERGKMIPSELEKNITKVKKQGKIPLYVSATAGTTVCGAFDPLINIADICEKYNLWMHVDVRFLFSHSMLQKTSGETEAELLKASVASWGGGLLLSRKHSHKLNGIESELCYEKQEGKKYIPTTCSSVERGRDIGCENGKALIDPLQILKFTSLIRANSVTWNPHKLMGVPLQCSAFLVHEKDLLQACNQLCADYLFQSDKAYDTVYDTGDKTIQCGRHVDVFKLWLIWRAKGTGGFEILINKFLELAEYLYKELKRRNNYELVFDAEVRS